MIGGILFAIIIAGIKLLIIMCITTPKNQNYPNKSIQTEEDWYNERAEEQYI